VRVLLVDLNNFARFPTLPVGLLAAVLRRGGVEVRVFSPLAHGLGGFPREERDPWWGLTDRKLRYWSAVSASPAVRHLRGLADGLSYPTSRAWSRRVLRQLEALLAEGHDAVLASTYTVFQDLCADIGRRCERAGTPFLVGGPYLNQPEVLASWAALPGVSAVVAGEPEPYLVELVEALAAGADLARFPGVATRSDPSPEPAPPLCDLDALPFADYADFPWERYPNRIVPMLTGRGCGWGRCRFCSDVTSAMGRTFRSRSPDNVLAELEHQSEQHDTRNFVFGDLKLNSNLEVWNALLEELPWRLPEALWTCAVHVGNERDNGLDFASLQRARRAGLIRLTTGLESGSQAVLDSMAKGTRIDRVERFLRDAHQAGISVRVTVVVDYPSETPDDLRRTARFLDEHADAIDRVMLNRLTLQPGTPLTEEVTANGRFTDRFTSTELDVRRAVLSHGRRFPDARGHRRSINRVLAAVHGINRRPLRGTARRFEGVM